MSHFQDGALLHLDHSIGHHEKELGHKPVYDFTPVDEFQTDWKMLPLATRRSPGMQAMVIAEAGFRAEDGNSRDRLCIEKLENVTIEKLVAGANICVQVNDDPQHRSGL
jgi:hypothetical protein